jgi:ribonuclease HII
MNRKRPAVAFTPDLSLEAAAGPGARVCGIDEAGRGPLAGPVVAAAVILPTALPDELRAAIDDSKKLSRQRRELVEPAIRRLAIVGVGRAEAEEIDRLNIHHATLLAMRRAFDALGVAADLALVDGKFAPALPCPAQAVVKGDSRSLSIAAASIVAKEERDRVMRALAAEFPAYGWERNAGYPTPEHLEALIRVGACPHHRRSFAPVSQQLALTR